MSSGNGMGPTVDGYFSGAGLLIRDTRTVLLLLNEARTRAIVRMFGVPREDSWLVTIIAIGALLQATDTARLKVTPPGPSTGDTVIAAGLLRAAAHGVAGDWARQTPGFNTLIAIAVIGATCRPLVRMSARDARAAVHRIRLDFDHRYGHLVRRNRPAS